MNPKTSNPARTTRLMERTEVTNPRFRAISSELGLGEAESVSAMPKERLLALLDDDARKYKLEGSSPDLGYITDFVTLAEKVKKYPWDDCAKFLAEREEIKRKIESRKKNSGPEFADFSGGRRTIEKEIVREDIRSSYPYSSMFGPNIVSVPPYVASDAYVGFGPMVIGPGEIRVFQVQSQNIFRGSRLVVDSKIASGFVLHDLRVGVMSLLRGAREPGKSPRAVISSERKTNIPDGPT